MLYVDMLNVRCCVVQKNEEKVKLNVMSKKKKTILFFQVPHHDQIEETTCCRGDRDTLN